MLRELPRSADRSVLLCTNLHAGNVLSSQREPWLVIDPKPFIGDPAFEPVQRMFNCEERLASDPEGLSRRMAELLELDAERVRLWLFVRCVQESIRAVPMREPRPSPVLKQNTAPVLRQGSLDAKSSSKIGLTRDGGARDRSAEA